MCWATLLFDENVRSIVAFENSQPPGKVSRREISAKQGLGIYVPLDDMLLFSHILNSQSDSLLKPPLSQLSPPAIWIARTPSSAISTFHQVTRQVLPKCTNLPRTVILQIIPSIGIPGPTTDPRMNVSGLKTCSIQQLTTPT